MVFLTCSSHNSHCQTLIKLMIGNHTSEEIPKIYLLCWFFNLFYSITSKFPTKTRTIIHKVDKQHFWIGHKGQYGLCSSFTDNIDDPTGNFRGTPLTGWKVFLLLLCALLGIVVCAVVGAVVFQKRQERNKRFYWGEREERRTLSERCLLWNELFSDDRLSTFNVNFFSKDCTNVYIFWSTVLGVNRGDLWCW